MRRTVRRIRGADRGPVAGRGRKRWPGLACAAHFVHGLTGSNVSIGMLTPRLVGASAHGCSSKAALADGPDSTTVVAPPAGEETA